MVRISVMVISKVSENLPFSDRWLYLTAITFRAVSYHVKKQSSNVSAIVCSLFIDTGPAHPWSSSETLIFTPQTAFSIFDNFSWLTVYRWSFEAAPVHLNTNWNFWKVCQTLYRILGQSLRWPLIRSWSYEMFRNICRFRTVGEYLTVNAPGAGSYHIKNSLCTLLATVDVLLQDSGPVYPWSE